MLTERGQIVVPDILANSGGVTVSHLEWVQNRSGFYWDASRVRAQTATAQPSAKEAAE